MIEGKFKMKYEIKPTSTELFTEVIETLPLSPIDFNFHLFLIPNQYGDGEIGYMRQCQEKGIIPYSGITLTYKGDWETRPNQEQILNINNGLYCPDLKVSEEGKMSALQMLILGGKINYISVKNHALNGKGFNQFRDQLLPEFLEQGYNINYGDIWLTYVDSGDEFESVLEMEDGLEFNLSSLDLRLYSERPESEGKQLIDWFSELQVKYDRR